MDRLGFFPLSVAVGGHLAFQPEKRRMVSAVPSSIHLVTDAIQIGDRITALAGNAWEIE